MNIDIENVGPLGAGLIFHNYKIMPVNCADIILFLFPEVSDHYFSLMGAGAGHSQFPTQAVHHRVNQDHLEGTSHDRKGQAGQEKVKQDHLEDTSQDIKDPPLSAAQKSQTKL